MTIITLDNIKTFKDELDSLFGLKKTVTTQKKDAKLLETTATTHREALDTNILLIDYESLLAFNTDLIVEGGATSAVLGVGVLGTMMLGTS